QHEMEAVAAAVVQLAAVDLQHKVKEKRDIPDWAPHGGLHDGAFLMLHAAAYRPLHLVGQAEQGEGGIGTILDREDIRLERVMLRGFLEPQEHSLARGEG